LFVANERQRTNEFQFQPPGKSNDGTNDKMTKWKNAKMQKCKNAKMQNKILNFEF